MYAYLPLLLIPAIAYFSWACGHAYGWTGYVVFLGALLVLAFAVVLATDGPEAQPDAAIPTFTVIAIADVLALISGAFGVVKRRKAPQSAGVKTPKSG